MCNFHTSHKLRGMAELKTVRLGLVIEPSLVEKVDEWRRSEPDLPSRSEAVRRLLIQSLETKPSR